MNIFLKEMNNNGKETAATAQELTSLSLVSAL
jgi:hypothetical protein